MKIITATVLLAIALGASTHLQAQESARGGASKLMGGHQITTQSQAEALKPGDSIVMACSKCKSIAVTHVTTEKGHIKVMTPGEKHLCPGCKSTITVVGVGKGAKDEVKHVCEKCGEDSAYCCAIKRGSGPTEGMEKK